MSVEVQEKLPKPNPAVIEAIEKGEALPLLDIGDFIAGKPGALEQLAADVRAIQESLGFYAIVNHGIDMALVDEAVEESFKLFRLPEDVKMRWRSRGHMQGYWPADSVDNRRPGFEDEKHGSSLGGWAFLRDREADDPKVEADLRHRSMNKWPDPAVAPAFRPVLQRYHKAMLDLAHKLVPVYARALDLPADYFDKDFTDPEWYCRCNHFAARPDAGPDDIAASAHSDHSFLTILPMSRVPGLQVRTPSRTWIDVRYVPGALIVNTGEWLNRLSNGRFMATPHRVTQPPVERISLPFFMDPNDDAKDDPVPGAVKPGEARRFPPMKWHAFFCSYIDGYTK